MRPVLISPLRLWLQSASLLAVVAGYCLLLLIYQGLAAFQRREVHGQLAAQVSEELRDRARSPQALRQLLGDPGKLPLQQLRLVAIPSPPGGKAMRPRMVQSSSQIWLVSQMMVPLPDQGPFWLQVEQNVTGSVQQERLGFWFLVVTAGLSSLFTSGLLRLVLRRGLTKPLEAFTAQLRRIEGPPRPGDAEVMKVAEQPEELRPIAEAFNALQQRLAVSWDRQRSFVDGVAHELRTPITLVSGYAQRLLRSPHDPALTPPLLLIEQESARMGTLVADLLDMARQDAGRFSLLCQPVQADDVLLALYERMAPAAEGRLQLAPASGNGETVPPAGLGDPDRLQQCLTALVDNALCYSPDPEPVTVGAGQASDGGLMFWVRDHGPGVTDEERELIFRRFMRGSAAQSSDQRGSGIGLAMVKLLMEAMGGRVQVVAAPGGGAEFQLRLHAVKAEAPPPSA